MSTIPNKSLHWDLNDRFWPKADLNFTGFRGIRTSGFGKSGHSGNQGEITSGEWLLYPETSCSGARIWSILSGCF
jgi:hypothetical protein